MNELFLGEGERGRAKEGGKEGLLLAEEGCLNYVIAVSSPLFLILSLPGKNVKCQGFFFRGN